MADFCDISESSNFFNKKSSTAVNDINENDSIYSTRYQRTSTPIRRRFPGCGLQSSSWLYDESYEEFEEMLVDTPVGTFKVRGLSNPPKDFISGNIITDSRENEITKIKPNHLIEMNADQLANNVKENCKKQKKRFNGFLSKAQRKRCKFDESDELLVSSFNSSTVEEVLLTSVNRFTNTYSLSTSNLSNDFNLCRDGSSLNFSETSSSKVFIEK